MWTVSKNENTECSIEQYQPILVCIVSSIIRFSYRVCRVKLW